MIEWTEVTWNPVTGCSKVSVGCRNCYAERMARRLKAMGQPNYSQGFMVTCHEHMLERPLGSKSPRRIFVNSMKEKNTQLCPCSALNKIVKLGYG